MKTNNEFQMNETAVELRNVTKIFPVGQTGRGVSAVHQMNLGIRSGEFFTLLGASGCGKTTTLRLIAGFEAPSEGEIFIQGRPMSRVPPHRRPVNTVFQSYALFPHLNVLENVAFGLAVKRVPRAERERRARQALELVRLPEVGDRKPAQLSGGQQQRVALARALVNQPAVLLLDEPLGALDLKLRKEMQLELKRLQVQVGITFIYVTHDQEEALTMSDRIAVMSLGVIQQLGTPLEIYERPASRFVADFIGETNFIAARVERGEAGRAWVRVGTEVVAAQSPDGALGAGQAVTLAVRPEKLNLARPNEPLEVPALSGTVRETVYIGTDTRYVVALATGEAVVVRIQNMGEHGLGEFAVGQAVRVWYVPGDARLLTA